MAPFLNFAVDFRHTADALTYIGRQLSRIGDALDRLAPILPASDTVGYVAGLSDLRRPEASAVAQIQSELGVFASNNRVALNSEAFIESIIKYEREVAEVYGEDSIKELPWNKAAGGLLFAQERTGGRSPQAQASDSHRDAEPPANPKPKQEPRPINDSRVKD